jgi:WD40-like Beta Propeller Repeat
LTVGIPSSAVLVYRTGSERIVTSSLNVIAGRAVYKNAEHQETSGWGGATLLREIIAKDVNTRGGEGKDLTIRTLYLAALIAAGVLMACAAALLAVSEKKAQAAFPGKNGKIAYVGGVIYTINPGGGGKTKVTDGEEPSYSPNGKRIAYSAGDGIYTIKVGGGDKTKVTEGAEPSFSPNGKRIAYTHYDEHDSEIYTIKVGGGGKTKVTNTKYEAGEPSWGSRL